MAIGSAWVGCSGGGASPLPGNDTTGIDALEGAPSSSSRDGSVDLPLSSPDGDQSDARVDGARDLVIEAAQPSGTCLPGATALDCQRCGSGNVAVCLQACPAVDCSVSPAPAECTTVCKTCCICAEVYAGDYVWTTPHSPVPCGTLCSDTYARWLQLMADPAMTACTAPGDCTVVGGQPPMDPCNGSVAIGGCGVAANAVAYQASAALALEAEYPQQCPGAAKAYDCGPGHATCFEGKCVIQGWGCCFGCNIVDAGHPAPADTGLDASDARSLAPPDGGGPAPVDAGGSSIDSGLG
jgi:hypothetical protein